MLGLLNKNTLSNAEQAEWFVQYSKRFLFEKLNARKEYISAITAFYNSSSERCILKITLDKKYQLHGQEPLYIMLNYQSKELSHSGRNFEDSICDKNNSIQWIYHNELLVFYPDNNIMSLLSKIL